MLCLLHVVSCVFMVTLNIPHEVVLFQDVKAIKVYSHHI